mmetsp:Transcript_36969/g.35676  ORF Transcript_36969/g.35676 Transcript_36969/m.35676 type:complete len:104 (-) Transcript_36969:440-751(-)|eukprot:CAMPEP_0170565824 /NCGR_PEP_ID=MMETSP0211-20121228/79431_1 /TAXON_ID=311385 /ORGANISM="Pseudokeronopsis sp., Strain OXSARD2" /LENGTH=103 /DNA_ID=CAMNT_0010886801 /DNA_START=1691 /DNA_END=2002 /DNA_ORIENTATION=-
MTGNMSKKLTAIEKAMVRGPSKTMLRPSSKTKLESSIDLSPLRANTLGQNKDQMRRYKQVLQIALDPNDDKFQTYGNANTNFSGGYSLNHGKVAIYTAGESET